MQFYTEFTGFPCSANDARHALISECLLHWDRDTAELVGLLMQHSCGAAPAEYFYDLHGLLASGFNTQALYVRAIPTCVLQSLPVLLLLSGLVPAYNSDCWVEIGP